MDRNEAIEVVKQNYPHVTQSGSQFETALRTLIPELKESEDERIRKHLIGVVELYYGNTDEQEKKDCLAWLEKQGEQNLANSAKTCKDGEKPAWSEEDIATISRAISIVKWAAYSYHSHPILNDKGATELVDRLKSLKERYTWKPSDEQMEYLAKAITTLGNEGDNKTSAILYELRADLKKLKG